MSHRGRGRVEVSGGFWLLAAWFGVANGWGLLGLVLFAAGIHELGHYAVLRLWGARVTALRLTMFGVAMETDCGRLSYGRELTVVLAGPAVNFLCAVLLAAIWRQDAAAGAHLALGLFNLLPVRPLDGGRALWLALTWAFGPAVGERGAQAVGSCLAAVLAVGLLAVMGESGGSLWLLPAACGLLAAAAREAGAVPRRGGENARFHGSWR